MNATSSYHLLRFFPFEDGKVIALVSRKLDIFNFD